MFYTVSNFRIKIEEDSEEQLLKVAAKKLKIATSDILAVKKIRRSLDARKKEQFYFEYTLALDLAKPLSDGIVYKEFDYTLSPAKKITERPLIVGFGPAGIFAALTLLELGAKPIIFERGKPIEERDKDVEEFILNKNLNLDSNIQFGEGGAGAYSDGKLNTRVKNSFFIGKFLKILIDFGAPPEIAYQNKPHLGTEVIRQVVKNIKQHLITQGVEINFNSKLTGLIFKKEAIAGIEINGSDRLYSANVFLAIGHSARDTFALLLEQGVPLQQKPFAVGTRIEHPREEINLMQYGKKYYKSPLLGAADYALTSNNYESGRGIFSFCMCPGGEVVAASSEEEMLAVNGMSYANRKAPFSNAALVVSVSSEDFNSNHPLAGLEFQRELERAAFVAGGSSYLTPAQNLKDFLTESKTKILLKNSQRAGTVAAELNSFLPQFICDELRYAFNDWQKRVPLFISEQAVLIGAESRTWSCQI